MAGRKSFDDSEVLQTALRIFIAKGYSSTSMRDIEKASRLSAGSLYFTFKNKRALFRQVMNHYLRHVVIGRIEAYLGHREFHKGVRAYFESTFTNKNYRKCGCLLTITSAEPGLDKAVARKIETGFKIIEEKFVEIVRRAQKNGEIDRRKDPALIAQHLFTSYQGLLVLVRFGKSNRYLKRATDAAITLLH
ncbi:MAG: TetR/AcrR family transcriptional regulator [Gammaproteobacteria bacterium]|nr:TetR/AcrR family transcriptional regulator [Gammaproteobacteria bacterium]